MMVQRKRTYKRRTYKKRTYKPRRYKRVYRRRYYKPIKKPEIHIMESGQLFNSQSLNGSLNHLTEISDNGEATNSTDVKFKLQGKDIEGRKIRLKYLYIKGYLNVSTDTDLNDFNGKFYVFRMKKNLNNQSLTWTDLLDMPEGLVSPGSWTDAQRLDVLYSYNWKNDINTIIKKKVKNLYRKYDSGNNIVPFKLRIPLYDCVLTCDTSYSSSSQKYSARIRPSTNDIYYSFLTNKTLSATTFMKIKMKLYYTDY